jgi:hypothetical protein
MAYQNTQPLGSQARGGGGGWRALSFINSFQQPSGASSSQAAALQGGAGPVTEAEALQFLKQKDQLNSILGLGSNTVSGSLQPYANAYGGYTAGTGNAPAAKGSSY